MGQVKNLVSMIKPHNPPQGRPGLGYHLMVEGLMGQELLVHGEEALGERVSPLSQEPLPSPKVETPSKDRV